MKDLIFQKFCVSCEEPGDWVCTDCKEDFPFVRKGYCSVCGAPFQNSKLVHPCFDCASKAPAYKKHRAVFSYEGPIKDLVQSFKYKGDFWVREFYKQHLESLKKEFSDVDLIVPIPLHQERLIERGFNQSLLLAEVWQKALSAPVVKNVLLKIKETPSQVGLPKIQRIKSLSQAFAVEKNEELQGKVVLLVDDVHTTGSTLHAAAKALQDAGAQTVYATSFAIVKK